MSLATASVDESAARAALLLKLRTRGVRDLAVLRAMELIGRERFVPPTQARLAGRDLALPAPCGGIVPEPWLVARMAEALGPMRDQRVLEIGTGSGYATAVLAHLSGHVVTVERYRSQAAAARVRFSRLGIGNISVLLAAVDDLPRDIGRFARVLVHGCLEHMPASLMRCVAPGGILVFGRRETGPSGAQTYLIRATSGGNDLSDQDVICACRLPQVTMGVAAAL